MTVLGVRVFLFSILPLALSAGILFFDRSANSRERRLEVPLILLFGLGVAGSGIASFFGHFFLSDVVADAVGWPRGNPFQLEMAFANLAVGALGLGAAGRRDGFREATVIAATVLGVGASIVHLLDIVTTGNMAPGNTIQNVANLIKPACLVPLLLASRLAERSEPSTAQTPQFERWRAPLLRSTAVVSAVVATAFGVGFALGRPVACAAVGTVVSGALTALILAGSPSHRTAA